MRLFRDGRFFLIVLLLLSWTAGVLFFMKYKKSQEDIVAGKDEEIAALNTTIANVEQVVSVCVVAGDVKGGSEVKEEDITYKDIPANISTGMIQDVNEAIGKYYKLDMAAGTPITYNMLFETKLTDDLRLYDIITNTNPIGLEEGAYVDIRIAMPMGEDYVAIAHKQVKQINDGILKLAVTENDIHAYNSMLIDCILYPGSQIYAVEYLEGGAQKAAEIYYPVSKSILALAEKDPNLLTTIRKDMLNRRQVLEKGMEAAGAGLTEEEMATLNTKLEQGRLEIQQQINTTQAKVAKEKVDFEKQQDESASQTEDAGK